MLPTHGEMMAFSARRSRFIPAWKICPASVAPALGPLQRRGNITLYASRHRKSRIIGYCEF